MSWQITQSKKGGVVLFSGGFHYLVEKLRQTEIIKAKSII
jgi:hypothetical protein